MEKKHKKTLGFILILLIINTSLILPISAETTIDTDTNDAIDQEQNHVNTVKLIYNQNQIAQSFTPTLPKISRIKLLLAKRGEISSDLTLIIKEKISNPPIREISISPENISDTEPEWIEFNFTDIDSESNIYYFLCKTDSGDTNNYYEIYGDTTNSYKNGTAYLTNNSGNTWFQDTKLDFTFITYGAGPILNIEFIKGLTGGRILIGIKNIGTSNSDNLKITAIFTGGLLLKKYFEEKPNISLEPDHVLNAELYPIIGFGMTNLELYITSNTSKRIESKREIFILFLYIYVKPQ